MNRYGLSKLRYELSAKVYGMYDPYLLIHYFLLIDLFFLYG
ncbi:hypothetical protein Mal15_42690 [Stieleria maiorica]|uniref:Uncharacterized protein n=1 Tax=Stieleria maiorica TaxID=2795974 RepID=A0A5B9MI69_9BACT|nr:hypothetical protein Mal15_42690 [Stieleria maiorica]